MMALDADVVVVGAGYAGLSAALALHDAGREVLVLEARDRVGGRVWTRDVGGVPMDMGGMWLGADHHRFAAMAARFGAATYPTPEHGATAIVRDGVVRRAGSLPLGWRSLLMVPALLRLRAIARRVDPNRPWAAAGADRLDRTTVEAWLRRWVPDPAGRALLSEVLTSSESVEPVDYSLLTLAGTIADQGGLDKLFGTDGGAQQDLFHGGADSPARGAAALLGDRVRLGAAVHAIDHAGGVARISGHGTQVTARRVIVAIPPSHVLGLHIEPAIDARRRTLLQRLPMGSVYKAGAVYQRPFWRNAGWSGDLVSPGNPITSAFDATPPGGPGVLMTLVCGRAAQRLAAVDPATLEAVVLDAFAAWFGPAGATPLAFSQVHWDAEPWSGGGYSAIPTPGTITSLWDVLAVPDGLIHWAGTETASRSSGFIEGAVRSGERAAAEALKALGA